MSEHKKKANQVISNKSSSLYKNESEETISEEKSKILSDVDSSSYINGSSKIEKTEDESYNSNYIENLKKKMYSYDFDSSESNNNTLKTKKSNFDNSKNISKLSEEDFMNKSYMTNFLKNNINDNETNYIDNYLQEENISKENHFNPYINRKREDAANNSFKRINSNNKYNYESNYKTNDMSFCEKKIMDKEINDSAEFENMVSDLRITFINWLKKTQMNFLREKEKLIKERKEMELEKIRMYKEIENKKNMEEEKIQEERKKLDIDISNSYKQLKIEKEENRKRFDEERLRFFHEIDKMKLILHLEKEKHYEECKNFEVEKKKIVDANIATETMIEINVGGVVFETSRHTLTQQKNSFIEKLLSGKYHVARDKNGRIFLDRDNELFRIILNFLRNPLNIPIPKNLNESQSLLKEAEFYGIKFLPFPLAFSLGGFDGVDYLNSVELLDISQQCWRMCTPMNTKKAYFGSSVLNNFLYVFGGNNYDYKALFETEVYDRLRDIWYKGPNLNIPRRNNSGITLNHRIYSIGGYDGNTIIPNVEAYDNRMKAWLELAPLNTPRSSSMSVILDNKIYVIGGTNGQRLNTIEIYDEKMNMWQECPHKLLESRSSGSAFSYLNQLYVLGGIDNEHNILSSMENYQTFSKRWQFLTNIPEKRMNFAGSTLSDSYIITGGENEGVLNSCYFFSPDSNEWQLGPSLLVPRFGHAVLIANL